MILSNSTCPNYIKQFSSHLILNWTCS